MALGLLGLALAACGGAPASPHGSLVPAPLAGGAPLESTIAGRVAVIDMWATWCRPCRAAIPGLRKLSAELTPRGGVVVGVNVGESAAEAAEAVATFGIDYPVYSDPNFDYTDAMGSGAVPTILVLDRTGKEVHRSHAVDAETRRVIEALLAAPSAELSSEP